MEPDIQPVYQENLLPCSLESIGIHVSSVFTLPTDFRDCYARSQFLISSEAPRDKTNKMACAPREDSAQTRHPPSLIRVFAVRMKKVWVLSYPLSSQRRLVRLDGCPVGSESRWAHSHFVGFVTRWFTLLKVPRVVYPKSCGES